MCPCTSSSPRSWLCLSCIYSNLILMLLVRCAMLEFPHPSLTLSWTRFFTPLSAQSFFLSSAITSCVRKKDPDAPQANWKRPEVVNLEAIIPILIGLFSLCLSFYNCSCPYAFLSSNYNSFSFFSFHAIFIAFNAM